VCEFTISMFREMVIELKSPAVLEWFDEVTPKEASNITKKYL